MIVASWSGAILIYPLGITGDFPNQLAQAYIIGNLNSTHALSQYYYLDFGAMPNLAMSLFVPPLSRVFGVYSAGGIYLTLVTVTAYGAAMLLASRPQSARMTWYFLIGFTTFFSLSLEFGLANFLGSVAMALAAFAIWVRSHGSLSETVFFAFVGIVLFFAHALGFLLFGYLVLLWEISAIDLTERAALKKHLRTILQKTVLVFAPGLGLLFIAVLSAQNWSVEQEILSGVGQARLTAIFSPFNFYRDGFSKIVMFASFAVVFVGALIGLREGFISINRRRSIVVAGLAVIAFGLPENVLGVWGLHFRFGSVFLILLASSLETKKPSPIFECVFALAIGFVILLQFAHGVTHLRTNHLLAKAVVEHVAELPDGARILPVSSRKARDHTSNYLPSYSVIETNAFVPNLFTNSSPVSVKSEWLSIQSPGAFAITPDQFRLGGQHDFKEISNGIVPPAFYGGWPENFTHVFFLRENSEDELEHERLCPMSSEAHFALYRINAAGELCPGP